MVNIKKEVAAQMDAQEPYQESSDESMNSDSRQNFQDLRFPSSATPEDYYQYKKFVNLPESQAEFMTIIDKDVVFSNLGGSRPSLEELRFQVGTISLFESEFIEEVWIPRRYPDGSLVKDNNSKVVFDLEVRFDEVFRGCLNFLKGQYKFDVVGSRAQGGQDRAAFLDISSSNRISKEFNKKNDKKQGFFGTGGN